MRVSDAYKVYLTDWLKNFLKEQNYTGLVIILGCDFQIEVLDVILKLTLKSCIVSS